MKNTAKIVAEAAIDALAICGMILLAALGKVSADAVIPVVVLISGASLGSSLQKVRASKADGSSGPSIPPGASSIVVGMGAMVLDALKHSGKLVLPLALTSASFMVSGCSGQSGELAGDVWRWVRGACGVIVRVAPSGEIAAVQQNADGTETPITIEQGASVPDFRVTDTDPNESVAE